MKPGDVFVGVTDFFSILLPGAALTFIGLFLFEQLRGHVPADHLLMTLINMTGAAAWAGSAVVSYIVGTSSRRSAPGSTSCTTNARTTTATAR